MNQARRTLLLLAGTVLLSVFGRAEEGVLASRKSSDDVVITLTERSVELYELEGQFEVKAPPSVAWGVLTDYEGISKFVPSVQTSRVLSRDGNHARIEQSMAGSVLFFSHKVSLTLQVNEEPKEKISFDDVARRDFILYAGQWEIRESAGGSVVHYSLKAEPAFHVPKFLARGAFKRNVRELLQDVRREMLRRDRKQGVL